MPRSPYLAKIHDVDPYEGFDATPYPDDLTGWGGNDPVFSMLIDKVQPRVIVEVGTWKGQSALNMVSLAKKYHEDVTVFCVDTWLGSSEFWMKQHSANQKMLNLKNGFPSFYYQFLANVVRAKAEDHIVPIPLPSAIAKRVLGDLKGAIDLIYIDGDHAEDSVYQDISLWYPLLSDKGIMFGHDQTWRSVRKAVWRYSHEIGIKKYIVINEFWIMRGRTNWA